MCSRVTLKTPADVIAGVFGLDAVPPLTPRFNIAPSQNLPAVVSVPAEGRRRALRFFRWGLVPSWAPDTAVGSRSMINARAETVFQKPAYRAAVRERRCLVVVDGFYEWRRRGGRSAPFYFRMGGGAPFAIAAIFERWHPPEGEQLESCAILTTASNDLVREVHDRMPLIVAPADYDLWLDPAMTDIERLKRLIAPYPPEAMAYHPVSPRVNRPAFDDPSLIRPVPPGPEERPPAQGELPFGS